MSYMRIYARWRKIVSELRIGTTPRRSAHIRTWHADAAHPYVHVRQRNASVRRKREIRNYFTNVTSFKLIVTFTRLPNTYVNPVTLVRPM